MWKPRLLVDYNVAYSQSISQLCCQHQGVPWKESDLSFRRTTNSIVLRSNETIFLWKSHPPTQQQKQIPNSRFFPFPLSVRCDKLRSSSHCIQKRNALIKGNKQCFGWQLESITGMGYCTALRTDKNTFWDFH